MGDSLLKKLEVPIITRTECEAKVPVDFQSFILPDKYCAGHFTGKFFKFFVCRSFMDHFLDKSVCTGDSGGGLITVDNHNFHTLRGVVSTSPVKDGTCDNTQIATYTKISSYLDFITQANEWVKILPMADERLTGGQNTSSNVHPWQVAVYAKILRDLFVYKCAGTIINTITIVTSKYNFYMDDI